MIGLVFGGKTVEHDISIMSAINVAKGLLQLNFPSRYFYIDSSGKWFEVDNLVDHKISESFQRKRPVVIDFSNFSEFDNIDVFFPIVHGTTGEDGALQGLFELIDKPYVGPGIKASAICMDKEFTKKLSEIIGIKVAKYISIHKGEKLDISQVEEKIGYPCFVKPASLGSSVGISKVKNENELLESLKTAYLVDDKILIEEELIGHEVECAVIGYRKPQVSLPVRLIINHEYYSFDAKYNDPNGAFLEIPYKADDALLKQIQEAARKIYVGLDCASLARIDFFITEDEGIYLNEVNTLPGFRDISAFPQAWKATGVDLPSLLEILIVEAILRFEEKKQISRTNLQTIKMC